MSGYTPGFSVDDYDELKSILRELGQRLGSFDANQAGNAILSKRLEERGVDVPLGNAGDFITILQDMTDLGYLREAGRRGEGGPVVWEYVES
jgi:hypothetical protein